MKEVKEMLNDYSEMLSIIQNTMAKHKPIREMWLSDISAEFIREYNSCEFVKLYPNDDDEIVFMARQAAENFLANLLQENRKSKNEVLHFTEGKKE